MTLLSGGAILVAALTAEPANACGGFFCQQVPVDQDAERIVFAYDDATGTIETNVQIFYTGEAEEFAWVVPVPQIPEIFVSTDQLFDNLAIYTAPTFWPAYDSEGECDYSDSDVAMEDGGSYSFSSTAAPPSVQIIETQQVGPYETVTLQADSTAALLGWLQDNDYDLPDAIEPLLTPYVAGESYFIALRLANGFDTGDITPLGFRYAGDRPQIPIQLTSIAASPDMRLEVYVLGPARAVPESYLHLQINEAAIDWSSNGSNYEDVVSLAANEAGGHGFATDYAGLAVDWSWILPSEYDLDPLYAASGPVDWMDAVISAGIPSGDATLAVLKRQIPMPQDLVDQGLSDTDFYNCLACYQEYLGDIDFDATRATDDLAINVTDPIEHAQDLFERHHWLSRMTSSLDAVEMTVDPVFVFNDEMGLVDLAHEATLTTMCETGTSWYDSIRRVTLADGRVVYYPSQHWLDENGLTVAEWLLQWNLNAAAVIEQTAAEGEPTVLFDLSAESDDALDDLNDWVLDTLPVEAEEAEGCGCQTAPMGAGWMVVLGALALRRRRG